MALPSPRFLFSNESDLYPCIIPNCTAPSQICFYDACLSLPLPPLPSPPDSIPVHVTNNNHRLLTTFLISSASLLFLSLLLLLLFFSLRRRLQRAHHHHAQPPPPVDLPEDDDNDDWTHHVWYIRTVGLDDAVIKSIAATVYRSGEGLIDGGDCSVCLGEFSDGEAIKLLPKCAHAFHLSCIDTWLKSHVNCPLCRAPVVAPVGLDDSGPSEIEIVVQPPNQADCASGSSSSLGPLDENQVQPIRRSVSMDSLSIGMLMKEIGLSGVVVSDNEGKGDENLGKQMVEMKRSLSSRSGRLFFSRYGRAGRGRSASILPL